MRELQFISAQPNDLYFCWQLRVQLHNFRKHGYSHLYTPLILYHRFREDDKDFQEEWDKLQADFPETKFYFYEDKTENIHNVIQVFGYVSLLRPWLLHQHWGKFPELEKKAIFYLDSDVIFTKKLDFTPFLEDDINYLSDTIGYIGAKYWDSKKTQKEKIKTSLYSQFQKIDVLDQTMRAIGMNRKVADENQDSSGGAQYLLKNIKQDFWMKVLDSCMVIKMHLHVVNQRYFAGDTVQQQENNGFQAWCADMWAVLWNLWKFGGQTKVIKELDFAHATDSFEKLKHVYLYHDAGAVKGDKLFKKQGPLVIHGDKKVEAYAHNLKTPYDDELVGVPPETASYFYVTQLLESKDSFTNP